MNKQLPQGGEESYQLTLEGRRRAVLTGVTDVESFDEESVVLRTHGGRLTLTGSGLHVSHLQLENGRLQVEGEIDAAMYDNGPLGRKRAWRRRGSE